MVPVSPMPPLKAQPFLQPFTLGYKMEATVPPVPQLRFPAVPLQVDDQLPTLETQAVVPNLQM